MARRRIAAAVGVGTVVALAPHGHHVRPDAAPSTALRPHPGGDSDMRIPHIPLLAEASRSAPLVALPAPDASTSSTEARAVPSPVRAAGRDLGLFRATCFDLRGTTASGAPSGPGSIAVDPAVIPLGTHLHVAGYGDGVAADTGGAITGRRVDVWKSSAADCDAFGVRWVDVEEAA